MWMDSDFITLTASCSFPKDYKIGHCRILFFHPQSPTLSPTNALLPLMQHSFSPGDAAGIPHSGWGWRWFLVPGKCSGHIVRVQDEDSVLSSSAPGSGRSTQMCQAGRDKDCRTLRMHLPRAHSQAQTLLSCGIGMQDLLLLFQGIFCQHTDVLLPSKCTSVLLNTV